VRAGAPGGVGVAGWAGSASTKHAVCIAGLRKEYQLSVLPRGSWRRIFHIFRGGSSSSAADSAPESASELQTPPAVDDLWLTADEGEVLCLLGPNGSGKTTTLGRASHIAAYPYDKSPIPPHRYRSPRHRMICFYVNEDSFCVG